MKSVSKQRHIRRLTNTSPRLLNINIRSHKRIQSTQYKEGDE
jgi:hypothetical protein